MENKRLIINIRSDDPTVITDYHLDWFEFGVWCEFDAVDFLIQEIKKSLSFELTEGYGAAHYYSSLYSDLHGIKIFYDLRAKLKNPPINIRCSGTFFRYSFSYSFCDGLLRLLNGLNIRFQSVRYDAAVDFVSMGEHVYIPVPEVLPQPGSYQKEVKYGRINDRVLDEIKTYPYSGDALLRIYNKLTDRKDPDFIERHPEYKGALAVWRLEFQFRSDTLRAVQINGAESFKDYWSLFAEILGQCFRRYKFKGFEFNPSSISSYIPKKTDELASLNHAHNQMLSWFRKHNQLEKQIYRSKNPFHDEPTQSVIDLMAAFDQNNKEVKAVPF